MRRPTRRGDPALSARQREGSPVVGLCRAMTACTVNPRQLRIARLARSAQATSRLSPQQVEHFRAQGYLTPLPGIPAAQAIACGAGLASIDPARLAALDAAWGSRHHEPWRTQTHVLFKSIDAIVRHPTILDTVEDLLGPNLLVANADLFVKEPHSPSFVSFHQDSYYWHIEPDDMISVWVALSAATPENGCMRYAPRSHHQGKQSHVETFAADNALSRGQAVSLGEGAGSVEVVLEPGQIAIHHCLLAHASGPNRTGERRLGLTVRYMPPEVRIVTGPRMAAVLVRGEDRYGHFAPAPPRPAGDLDDAAIAAHLRVLEPHAADHFSTA